MVGTVHTREEALAEVHQALGHFSGAVQAVMAEAQAAANAVYEEAGRECSAREATVSELQRILVSLGPDQDPAPVVVALSRAEARVAAAHRARAQAAGGRDVLASACRRLRSVVSDQVVAARADLGTRSAHLAAYSTTGWTVGAERAVPTHASAPPPGGAAAKLAAMGLQEVELDRIDFSDNPVVDGGRGGASLVDYRWAAETWESTVKPGLATGMTRDDFAARDAARDAQPLRRTADVYDMFVGSDAIRLSLRPNGTWDVIGGRHRIEAARQLGIRSLPARNS